MMNIIRSYSELNELKSFQERFEYLNLSGTVGIDTFGSYRYLNQKLYSSPMWKSVKNRVIIRDNGCDLGLEGYDILGKKIIVHHINPITIDDLLNNDSKVFDMDNLICCRHETHLAIHYGNYDAVSDHNVERFANDMCPWKR